MNFGGLAGPCARGRYSQCARRLEPLLETSDHGWNGQQGGGRWQSSAEFFSFYVTNRWQRKSQSLFCCVFAMTSPSTGFAARSKLLLNSIPPVPLPLFQRPFRLDVLRHPKKLSKRLLVKHWIVIAYAVSCCLLP